ncbi:MAG: hypothetical protein JW966_06170, partial [Anaerolineae bacterium]|nr:hypothetical protein [Anaerolineae bacterium]
MHVRTRVSLIWRVAIALALCAGVAATTETTSAQDQPGYTPRFEPAACAFDIPAGHDVTCGYLVVPEDRSQPDGSWIKLHVAVFKSRSATPLPDPVIYLAGGGGYNQLDNLTYY